MPAGRGVRGLGRPGRRWFGLLLAADGPDTTAVTMREDAIGPMLVPRPVRRLVLVPRNVESLRRLDLLARVRQERQG
jgi:hypothetical protein